LHGIGDFGGLITEHQQAFCVALAHEAIKRNGLRDFGKAQYPTLFRGLDDIGAHPLAIDPRDLGETRQNRLQPRGAHLDRLLHDVVEPGMLQRRKDVGDVGQAILRSDLVDDRQLIRPLAARDLRPPLAVLSVEHEDGIAGLKPQHIAKIIALVPRQRDALARAQGGVDEQVGGAKIEFRHL
jgi:hypothetical protein